MKIKDSWLVEFLEIKEQGRIPIFQRMYSWKTDNCARLLDDILKIAEDENRDCHFVGSVIYENCGRESGVSIRHIIDGQQRLTTISLLLLALLDYCEIYYTSKGDEYEETLNQLRGYLFNDVARNDIKMKLHFNGDADFEYQNLLTDRNEDILGNNNKFVINYNFFLERIKAKKISPNVYLNGIQKLRIVDIEVEDRDDAHLIFETVNGTGLELTGAELIKNYILMTVLPANQYNLYMDTWRPMEIELGKNFDIFFKYYLTTVAKKEISEDSRTYYEEFKEYATSKNTEDLVRIEINNYFSCYKRWNNASKWSDNQLDKALARLRETGQKVITPVVLLLLSETVQIEKNIEKETSAENKEQLRKELRKKEKEVIRILHLLETYFVRLKFCEIDSKNIGDMWLKILKSLSSDVNIESIKTVFEKAKDTNQHMPTDADILEHLKEYQIYNKKTWCRNVLDRIERKLNKDYTHDSQWTIEHIMPQTIYSPYQLKENFAEEKRADYDWASLLGGNYQEIHTKYLNTIGNLTLSGYNPDYQNLVFSKKRDMGENDGEEKKGYKFSTIRITQGLMDNDAWGEKEILERTNYLGKLIIKIWSYYNKH